jgi:hypothetical protein
MPTTLYMYEFRYIDRLRGKWMTARYRREAPGIRCRYADYELVGAPEVRHVPDDPLANSAAHLARGVGA